VYSIDERGTIVVPIAQVNRVRVENHRVKLVELDDGRELRISAHHPLAGRGSFADLVVGSRLGEKTVRSVRSVPYSEPFTYDILPDSPTGAYYAGGALIGSTLFAIGEQRPKQSR
jgi:hypothetical protein